jgi:hypothetical protein
MLTVLLCVIGLAVLPFAIKVALELLIVGVVLVRALWVHVLAMCAMVACLGGCAYMWLYVDHLRQSGWKLPLWASCVVLGGMFALVVWACMQKEPKS